MPVTTALPVSFAGTTINYNFTTPADQAYGTGSQKSLGGGIYGLYTGELDHDAFYFIDGDDNTIMEPAVILSDLGYLLEDLDGSGYVDGDDNVIMEPNVIISPYFQNPLNSKKKYLIINMDK